LQDELRLHGKQLKVVAVAVRDVAGGLRGVDVLHDWAIGVVDEG
jgi:hypothetical protein